MKKISIATVFSGIGAPEQALKKLNVKSTILFACDNGEIELEETADEIKEKIKGMNDEQRNEFIKNLYASTGKHNYMKVTILAIMILVKKTGMKILDF